MIMKTYYTLSEYLYKFRRGKLLGLTIIDYVKIKQTAFSIARARGEITRERSGDGVKQDMRTITAKSEIWDLAIKHFQDENKTSYIQD